MASAPLAYNRRMSKPASSGRPARMSLHALLGQASRQVTAELRRTVAAEGLPVEFWPVLELLADEQGRNMSVLAREIGMQMPATSKIIDRMVEAALVQRSADPADQRRVILHISDFGLLKVAALHQDIRLQRDRLHSRFGAVRERQLKALLSEFIQANQSAS